MGKAIPVVVTCNDLLTHPDTNYMHIAKLPQREMLPIISKKIFIISVKLNLLSANALNVVGH